jgi:hypothetical protein
MRLPRGYPQYPWGDNEKDYFGDGNDVALYFDGTYFRLESVTHELLVKLSTAAEAFIYGGKSANDSLTLIANPTNTNKYIKIYGANNIELSASAFDFISTTGLRLYTDATITSIDTDIILTPVVNSDVFLNPTGTGRVKFGTKTGHVDQAIDGYITMQDAAGNALYLATVTPV